MSKTTTNTNHKLTKPAATKPKLSSRSGGAEIVLAQVVPPPEPEEVLLTYDEPAPEPEPTEPAPEPESEPEPAPEPVPSGVTSPEDKYLRLYTEHIRIQDENVRLRRKVIRLEEDLKRWRNKKTTKKARLEGEELTNAIVDIILSSSLNIENLPDEVERELYSYIINQITTSSGSGCLRKLFFCA